MSDMPALFTVLVGDDPERRVATFEGSDRGYGVNYGSAGWWCRSERLVHDVRPFIPEGTPVERVVVLPVVTGEVQTVTDNEGREYLTVNGCRGRLVSVLGEDDYARALHDAACVRVLVDLVAARAAEPTPDPLAQAREEAQILVDSDEDECRDRDYRDALRALLAATEGTGGAS
jgi:hypothetical protein